MSKYRITLEGKIYEMDVERIEESPVHQASSNNEYTEFRTHGKDPTICVLNPSAQRETVTTTGVITAPMPGTIIRVEKKAGDTVKAGELVLILEAMKMENEILAPLDGIISLLSCETGDTVAGGDVLFEMN